MKFSVRTKLLAAFTLNLVLMIALGIFALRQFGIMNQKATFIEATTIPSLDITDQFNFGMTKYRSLQLEYIINNSAADKNRIEGEMATLEVDMAAWINRYEQLITTAAEQQTFEQWQTAWTSYVVANNKQFLPASRQSNTGTVQPALNRLNPLYEDVLRSAAALVGQSQQQATAALDTVRSAYATSRIVVTAVTMTTLLISGVIGFVLATRLARRVERLTRATLAVAGGDLGRRVLVRGNDDIARLSTNFNQMVSSLRDQHELLEHRNLALQTSLNRQQQLTDDLLVRTEAEAQALRAQAAAEATSQAKSMFVATMSHEFRTPLNAILGYTKLLQLGATMRGQPEIVPDLARITAAGKHLLTLVTNILDFSKLEQGRMTLDVTDVDVRHISEEVIGIVSPLADANGNTLQLDLAPMVGTICADAGKLRQILFNLVSNALKFTTDGTITLRVRRETADAEDWLHFAVLDTGIGITPDQQSRLFMPFTQADVSTTRKYGGTGLGLSLSRELCHLMGGDISVVSETGVGSTFTAHLPACIVGVGVSGSGVGTR